MKTIPIMIAAAALLATSGCASLLSGGDDDITVSTDPAGASCVLRREQVNIGTVPITPGSVSVSRGTDPIGTTCFKEGYQEATVENSSSVSGWTFGNIVFGLFGIITAAIDVATGAAYTYPAETNLTLQPITAEAVPIDPAISEWQLQQQ